MVGATDPFPGRVCHSMTVHGRRYISWRLDVSHFDGMLVLESMGQDNDYEVK